MLHIAFFFFFGLSLSLPDTDTRVHAASGSDRYVVSGIHHYA